MHKLCGFWNQCPDSVLSGCSPRSCSMNVRGDSGLRLHRHKAAGAQFTVAQPQHRLYLLPEPTGSSPPGVTAPPGSAISQCAPDATPPVLAAIRQGPVPRQHHRLILGHIAENGTAGSCDRRNEPQDVPKSCFVAFGGYVLTVNDPSFLRLASSPEYRLCGRSLCTAIPSAFFCPISTTSLLPRVMPVYIKFLCSSM